MADKELKKLRRSELVELLCQMRETVDELGEKNRQLQAQLDAAEERCAQQAQNTDEDRRAEEAALREEMRRVLEKVDSMGVAIQHCGEADRRIKAAEAEAQRLLAQAQEEADAMRAAAERDIAARREAFTRQCEELLRGQEALRRLMCDEQRGFEHAENGFVSQSGGAARGAEASEAQAKISPRARRHAGRTGRGRGAGRIGVHTVHAGVQDHGLEHGAESE